MQKMQVRLNNFMGFTPGSAHRGRGYCFRGQLALNTYNLLGLGKGIRKLPFRDDLNNC